METNLGTIFDIRRNSTQDGPGIRTAVLFKGCPLSCLWCREPEGQSPAPELMFHQELCTRCGKCIEVCARNAVYEDAGRYYTVMEHCTLCGDCFPVCQSDAREVIGKTVTVDEVMAIIREDQEIYAQSGGGVTFTGGEPLLQRAFLLELLKACKESGIHTVLDTCGEAPWEAIDSVRPWVDLFLYDVKVIDEQRHEQLTGVSNHTILSNLTQLAELGHQIVMTVPLIPGISDTEENLQAVGQLAASLPAIRAVELLPFKDNRKKYIQLGRPFRLENLHPIPVEEIQRSARQLATFDVPVDTCD